MILLLDAGPVHEPLHVPIEATVKCHFHLSDRNGSSQAFSDAIAIAVADARMNGARVRLDREPTSAYDPVLSGGRGAVGVFAPLCRRRPAQGGAKLVRDHNKAFCQIAADTLDCPGPVFEFGSFQVEGQEGYANLRDMFRGRKYIGCDMRPGLGVDRVEDVTAIHLADHTAGTVLCIETFEHVFEVWRAFDEVYRILEPGGVFLITSPFNFRIHGYPDDYWRMTPSCLRGMMARYGARAVGWQGYHAFPHTVMAVGIKSPVPNNGVDRLKRFVAAYQDWLAERKRERTLGERILRGVSQLHRSKGERRQVAAYHHAEFEIDVDHVSTREHDLPMFNRAG